MTATCRLATILNADVVGYSHLMEANDQRSLVLAAMHRLTADTSGYAGLITAGKEGMLERLKERRREIIDPRIAEHCGNIVKTSSDGILVEFPGPGEAVRCAVEMQRAMFERNAHTAADQRIAFRTAVSLGKAADHEAISTSTQLRALSEPGGVCVSRAVRALVRNALPYNFEDIGEHSVKDLPVPVRAYAMSADAVTAAPSVTAKPLPVERRWLNPRNVVIAAGAVATVFIWSAGWWSWLDRNLSNGPIQALAVATPQPSQDLATASHEAAQPADQTTATQVRPPPAPPEAPSVPLSIVVLPFANLSNDPSQQYLADAITDELISKLSPIAHSFVIARDTAFAYRAKSVEATQAGHELGVRYVLEGGVRRADDQVQIDVRLTDTETGAQLGVQRFDTDVAKLTEVEDEIALGLARTSGPQLVTPVVAPAAETAAADPGARELIMRGWGWYHRPYSTETWQEARRDFERALEIDPRSVDARIGLATTLSGKLAEGWTSSRQEDTERAEQLLAEALERDANQPAAHFAMGVLRQMQVRLPEAQAEYEATIALDHNHARAYLHLGETLMFLGEPAAAVPPIKEAMRLNPDDPNISTSYWLLGTCHLLLGQLDQAIDALKQAQAANSRLWFPHLYLAGAFGLKGDLDDARLALADSAKLNPAITSLTRLRGQNPWLANPRCWALQEKTVNVGLRRAGLPEE